MAIDPGRVKSLFQAAIEREDPDDRRAFVDREAGADAELRARLHALLAAFDHPPEALDRQLAAGPETTVAADPAATRDVPSASPASTLPEGPTPGYRGGEGPSLVDAVVAGRYKVRQEIGEGGMGTVYLAEQTRPLRRQVALKLIKPGMDSRTVLARFESERQALALMDHPNIAKVLDAGTTDDGRPFFAMELVKGVPLTDYCDRHRLDLRSRLSLFRRICSAVQHAHQKGIIHRDLKPTNILVESHDGKPVPKVIDFGLAKATSGMQLSEHSLFTAFGSVTGTPLYMAPEQATFNALDVDTRADIYALGVILYELLAGSTPIRRDTIKRAALDEMLRVIREDEPPTPSSRISSSDTLPSLAANRHVEPGRLSRLVKGDLDWIVMKALAKERERRFDSTIGLAIDVERFLRDEPVTAGPPTARYRFGKFVRRNRGRVAAAAMVLLALVGGVVGTTIGLVEARRQRTRAIAEAFEKEQARRAEAEQRSRAEKRLAQVAKMNEILGSSFADMDPYQPEKEAGPLTAILGERLDRAASEIEGEATGDPIAVARMQVTLGRSLIGLSRFPEAIAILKKARATLAAGLGPDDPDTLRSMFHLARAYEWAGEFDRSMTLFEETSALQRSRLGADHPETLRSLLNLARACTRIDHLDRAVRIFEEILPTMRAKLGRDNIETIRALRELASAYSTLRQPARAIPLGEEALASARQKLGDDSPTTIVTMNILAGAYAGVARWDRALELDEEAIELWRAKLGADHQETIVAMYQYQSLLTYAGQFARADAGWEALISSTRKKLGDNHRLMLDARVGRAENDMCLGRLDVAESALRAAVADLREQIGETHSTTISAQNSVGYVLDARGDAAGAVREYRIAVEWGRRTQDTRWRLAFDLRSLGRALLATEAWTEAEAALREALAIHETAPHLSREIPDDRSLLGAALVGQGRHDEAGPLLRSGYEGLAANREILPAYYRSHLPEALDRLIAFGEATGKADEVKAWKAERGRLSAEAPRPEVGKK